MNVPSRQAKSMMLNVIGRMLEFPTTGYILFRKEISHAGIKATEYTCNSRIGGIIAWLLYLPQPS
jgi:hypothetical protein